MNVVDGPRVQLHPREHVYPDVAVELFGRVAGSLSGHPWHVATSLLNDEGLLVVGLTAEQLQRGLAAERVVWRAAAQHALARFDRDQSDESNRAAIDEFSEAFLRAEQADLLLDAVRSAARDKCRDETGRSAVENGGLPPDAGICASVAPDPSRHDSLGVRDVDVEKTHERRVWWPQDRHHGTSVAERNPWGWS